MGNQSNDDRWNLVQLSLQHGFGLVASLLEKQANYNWGDDAFAKGAYAVYKPRTMGMR